MEDSSIRPYENCINVVYDNKGLIYEIPNYCINEPYKFELEFQQALKSSEKEILLNVIKLK